MSKNEKQTNFWSISIFKVHFFFFAALKWILSYNIKNTIFEIG